MPKNVKGVNDAEKEESRLEFDLEISRSIKFHMLQHYILEGLSLLRPSSSYAEKCQFN